MLPLFIRARLRVLGSDLIVNVDEDSGSGWKIDPNSWRVFVRGLKFFYHDLPKRKTRS